MPRSVVSQQLDIKFPPKALSRETSETSMPSDFGLCGMDPIESINTSRIVQSGHAQGRLIGRKSDGGRNFGIRRKLSYSFSTGSELRTHSPQSPSQLGKELCRTNTAVTGQSWYFGITTRFSQDDVRRKEYVHPRHTVRD
ncbi:hypothetical protein CIRG_03453 [Coccidioides immitis RMSCC 2394]|uniref:Uncharacterized protein n=1 Tax=Coccidioides immitis RMSCC 2394 TaxID=404692 RepID=A0A0J6Y524_COCIT|nr:hypothetical protein CIRG_03453 [Coccidioides immitis RMSCC 2394]